MSKAFCMFTEQPMHRYIINGWMVGGKFGVAYYDHSGEVRTDYHYWNHEDLIRLIAGFMLGSDEVLGYDPTVVRVNGQVTHVSVGKMEYRIVCTLFKSQDMWADKDRQWEEAEFLLECKKNDISSVPDVHSREDLCVGGIPDSTLRCRSPNVNRVDVEDRVHRHFMMSPLCLPLTAFSSKSELMQAFIDIIQTHWQLVTIGILHRDLSLNNLGLQSVVPDAPSADNVSILPTPSPHCSTISQFQEWRGIIIDFDYAIWIKPSLNAAAHEPCKRDRTGTILFMSVELLDPPPQTEVTNSFQHDLESLFYVFVWICSMYDAPGQLRVMDSSSSQSLLLLKWNENKEAKSIGETKKGHLSYGGSKLAACFSPYFTTLAPFCIKSFDALFPKNSGAHEDYCASVSPVTHKEVITIFERAVEQVLEEESKEDQDAIKPTMHYPTLSQEPSTAQKQPFDHASDSVDPSLPGDMYPICKTAPLPSTAYNKFLDVDLVPTSSVTVTTCEIFENVKSNDAGWDALAKQAVSLIVTITEKQQEDPTNVVSLLSAHCNLLIVNLEAIRTKMRKKSSQHWMKKVLRNSTDKDVQADFKRFLDHHILSKSPFDHDQEVGRLASQ
ncbi:hypothetical protein PILCRDRAFT_10726 [Piloderma croceum F 1598]|uniref:Fungal-type protein kinase domain-containing protein n=1 Tax=Piloderma croceum (strain F 1598) TaxID=765440 RepID=A0A0C3FGI0_PILCF|nr:hypothetical protein PILCRDRAFT_10726 [Piloderma croceum F 1598]